MFCSPPVPPSPGLHRHRLHRTVHAGGELGPPSRQTAAAIAACGDELARRLAAAGSSTVGMLGQLAAAGRLATADLSALVRAMQQLLYTLYSRFVLARRPVRLAATHALALVAQRLGSLSRAHMGVRLHEMDGGVLAAAVSCAGLKALLECALTAAIPMDSPCCSYKLLHCAPIATTTQTQRVAAHATHAHTLNATHNSHPPHIAR